MRSTLSTLTKQTIGRVRRRTSTKTRSMTLVVRSLGHRWRGKLKKLNFPVLSAWPGSPRPNACGSGGRALGAGATNHISSPTPGNCLAKRLSNEPGARKLPLQHVADTKLSMEESRPRAREPSSGATARRWRSHSCNRWC
jgi:hypothetical protein